MRLIGGYSWYFNNKYKRSGSLFGTPFKAKGIISNEHLVHVSCYVNLNYRVHQLGALGAKLSRSSWEEYKNGIGGFCKKEIVLDQFDSPKEYENFALDALPDMLAKRRNYNELEAILME